MKSLEFINGLQTNRQITQIKIYIPLQGYGWWRELYRAPAPGGRRPTKTTTGHHACEENTKLGTYRASKVSGGKVGRVGQGRVGDGRVE